MSNKVLIIGATSWLARNTVSKLCGHGNDIYLMSRDNTNIDLWSVSYSHLPVKWISIEDVIATTFDVVIDFSYPVDVDLFDVFHISKSLAKRNGMIIDRVKPKRYILLSTICASMDRAVKFSGPIQFISNLFDPYALSKNLQEFYVASATKNSNTKCIIIRLGNILGPAAPNYVCQVVSSIYLGKIWPNEVYQKNGNFTFVNNISLLIQYILNHPEEDKQLTRYTCVEYGAVSWFEYLNAIAEIHDRQVVLNDCKASKSDKGFGVTVKSIFKILIGLICLNEKIRILFNQNIKSRRFLMRSNKMMRRLENTIESGGPNVDTGLCELIVRGKHQSALLPKGFTIPNRFNSDLNRTLNTAELSRLRKYTYSVKSEKGVC